MDPNESIDLSSFGASQDDSQDQDQGHETEVDQGQGQDQDHGAGADDAGSDDDGDRGLGDDANEDDSEEWGEEKADDDDDVDPADDRESWRKTRLNKVVTQRDEARRLVAQREADAAAARREAEEAKARLAVYEAGGTPAPRAQQAPADGMPDMTAIQRYVAANDPTCIALAKQVEAIKAKADSFPDAGSYLEALSEAQTEYKAELRDKSREVRTHLESQRRTTVNDGQAYVEKLVKDYEERIESSTVPRIEVYARRLNENAASLHPAIREAVLTHEHQDIATAAIASNRAAFDWLVEATKEAGNGPLHPRAVAYVGELIAAYRENLGDVGPSSNSREKPSRNESKRGLPRSLRSRSSGSVQADDVDPFQHARDVLEGRKKDPELRRANY